MTKETTPRLLMKGLTYSPGSPALVVLLYLAERYRAECTLKTGTWFTYLAPSPQVLSVQSLLSVV